MHVALVGDRDADLADLAAGEDVVRVIAGLRRQVEGDREAGLTLLEVLAVELVGAPGVGVAGIGAHHPGTVALGKSVLAHPLNLIWRAPKSVVHRPRGRIFPDMLCLGCEVVRPLRTGIAALSIAASVPLATRDAADPVC